MLNIFEEKLKNRNKHITHFKKVQNNNKNKFFKIKINIIKIKN